MIPTQTIHKDDDENENNRKLRQSPKPDLGLCKMDFENIIKSIPQKSYYREADIAIYCADCRLVLPHIPNKSIDLVLTDPPWGVSREVVIHRSMNPKKYKYVGKDINLDFGEWDRFESVFAYREFTQNWLTPTSKCLKDGGHLISFFDQNKISYLIEDAELLDLSIRQHLYWLKTNPVPRARKVDFMISLEQACWFTKSSKSGATFNYQLGQQMNYVSAPIPGHTLKDDGERSHPTQKPFKVLAVWVNYLSNIGELVLDPFLGSGTTAYCAKKLGRKCIGIEIEERYCQIAVKRLSQSVMRLE